MRRTSSLSGGGGQVAWQRNTVQRSNTPRSGTPQRSLSSGSRRAQSRSATPTQLGKKVSKTTPATISGKSLTSVSVQKRVPRPLREASGEGSQNIKLDGYVRCMTCADTTIWCSEPDGTISIREKDGSTFGLIKRETGSPSITSLLFIPENGSRGPRVLLGQSDGTLTNVDAVRGERRSQDIQPHNGSITVLTLLSSGLVASGGSDSTICLLEVTQASVIILYTATVKSPVRTMSCKFDKLYIGTAHGHLYLSSLRHRDRLDQITEAQLHFGITAIAISKDKYLWVSCDKGAIHIIDKESLRIKTSVGGRGEGAALAVVSPSTGKVWIFRESGSVSVWDPITLEVTRTMQSGTKGLPICTLNVTAVAPDIEIWCSSQQEEAIHLWRDADYQVPLWCSSLVQEATDALKDRDSKIKTLESSCDQLVQQLTFIKDESQQETLTSSKTAETELAKRIKTESDYGELRTVLTQAYETHCRRTGDKSIVINKKTMNATTMRTMVATLLAASQRIEDLQAANVDEGAQLTSLRASKAEANARLADLQSENQKLLTTSVKPDLMLFLKKTFPKSDLNTSVEFLLSLTTNLQSLYPEIPLDDCESLVSRLSNSMKGYNEAKQQLRDGGFDNSDVGLCIVELFSKIEEMQKSRNDIEVMLGTGIPIEKSIPELIEKSKLLSKIQSGHSTVDTLLDSATVINKIKLKFNNYGHTEDIEDCVDRLLSETKNDPIRVLYEELFGSDPGNDTASEIVKQITTAVSSIQQGSDAIMIYELLHQHPLPKNQSHEEILSQIRNKITTLRDSDCSESIITELYGNIFKKNNSNISTDEMMALIQDACSLNNNTSTDGPIVNLYKTLFDTTTTNQPVEVLCSRIKEHVDSLQHDNGDDNLLSISKLLNTSHQQDVESGGLVDSIKSAIETLKSNSSVAALKEISTILDPTIDVNISIEELQNSIKNKIYSLRSDSPRGGEHSTNGPTELREIACLLDTGVSPTIGIQELLSTIKSGINALQSASSDTDSLVEIASQLREDASLSVSSPEDLLMSIKDGITMLKATSESGQPDVIETLSDIIKKAYGIPKDVRIESLSDVNQVIINQSESYKNIKNKYDKLHNDQHRSGTETGDLENILLLLSECDGGETEESVTQRLSSIISENKKIRIIESEKSELQTDVAVLAAEFERVKKDLIQVCDFVIILQKNTQKKKKKSIRFYHYNQSRKEIVVIPVARN